jgi:serine phosphatase RsbU (regulator of sigma subunit)
MLCRSSAVGSDYYLVVMTSTYSLNSDLEARMYETTLSDILIFTVLFMLVSMLSERLVVRNLHRINTSLRKITGGHLEETVWVHSSAEFTELSEDINKTVTALRGYISAAEERIRDELKLAAAIQDSALPKNFNLPSKNIDLYALMTPAKQVGGDFYDFFYIDADRLCLVIADVSGKGVPASLFMMRAMTAIKNAALSGNGPAEVLMKVNNLLCEGNDAEMFVTVWIGILDLRTGRIECANAGHEYPVVMRSETGYELLKDRHGLVLAAMPDIPMRSYEIQLNPGDRLFVYTDGVPEAINEKEEAYGTDRLVQRLNRRRDSSQQKTLEDVLQDIRNFAGSAEQFDDITMLGLTYTGDFIQA